MSEELVQSQGTVLVVEDEEPLLQLLEDQLTLNGFFVYTARNGKEGLDLALQKKPDLILLDLLMPKMNGITMLRTLKQDPWGRGIKVMVLTNVSILQELVDALGKDAFDYLIKSDYSIEDIVKRAKERVLTSV